MSFVVGSVLGRLLPIVLRTGVRFGTKSSLRAPGLPIQFSRNYGRLSPLAKRSVESLTGGIISNLASDVIKLRPYEKLKSKRILKMSMPYGYYPRRRTYSRYSRRPSYGFRRRYSRGYRRF